jgi:predicted site-specific integrase-resolvase
MTYINELPDRNFLKPSEVASLFDVSPRTVYLWHHMGMIETVCP